MIGWILFLLLIFILMFVAMKIAVKTFKMFIKAGIVALIFALIILGYTQLMPSKEPACAPCPKNNTEECFLSLCDCKCYFDGFQPEVAEGGEPRLCGINCLGEFGVEGCEYKEGKGCVEVMKAS